MIKHQLAGFLWFCIIAAVFCKNINSISTNTQIFNKNRLRQDKILPATRRLLSIPQKKLNSIRKDDTISIKDSLEPIEKIITTSSNSQEIENEKEELRNKLKQIMLKICSNLYQSNGTIFSELKTVIFEVQKINEKSYGQFLNIPNNNNSWGETVKIKLGEDVKKKLKGKTKLCLGKALFRNYLGKNGTVSMSQIFNGGENKMEGVGKSDITLLHQIDDRFESHKTPICLVFNGRWKTNCKLIKIFDKVIECSCSSLGYFYIDYKMKNDSNVPVPNKSLNLDSDKEVSSNISKAVFCWNSTESSNLTENSTLPENITSAKLIDESKYNTASYVLIGLSCIGVVILFFVLRRVGEREEDDENYLDDLDEPKYAHLHNEDMLGDSHI